MKNLVQLLVFVLVTAAFPAMAQQADTYTQDGETVTVTRYYDDGSVREQGSYMNDVPNGKWVQFSQEGEVMMEAYFTNGKKDGTWLVYRDNGATLIEMEYSNNILAASHKWKLEERNIVSVD